MRIRWRIWYTDDRLFDSDLGHTIDDLPRDGVLYVRIDHIGPGIPEGTHRVMGQCEWYWHDPKRNIWASDSRQTKEEIEARYPDAILLRGKWTSDEEIARIKAGDLYKR
jgi:hypothetical protein